MAGVTASGPRRRGFGSRPALPFAVVGFYGARGHMLFNSFAFAVFLPLVFVAFWLLPQRTPRVQNAFLILAACVFYGWWDYRFLSLLFFSSFVDYLAGIYLARTTHPGRRRGALALSLGTNLCILGVFKYFGFFVETFVDLLAQFGLQGSVPTLRIVLPVGLSFYTFQSMAYTIDIYRGRTQPEKNWIDFFAFVSYFPQLVAGPIQRAGDLLPQFQKRRHLDVGEARQGFEQALWGLAKKVLVADNLAGPVDQIFRHHASFGTPTLALGAVLFAVQIYCDFSGYSDIAIGISRFFGIRLTPNFAYPYFARNPVEFWQRWHISLSTWFRDYVYIPLGGNRVPAWRRHLNLLATFTISGLWHGANWTFVLWGLFHGLIYVGYVAWRGEKATPEPPAGRWPRFGALAAMGATFGMVCISWVFFRAATLADALAYLRGLFTRGPGESIEVNLLQQSLLLAGALLFIEWLARARTTPLELRATPRWLRWPIYYAVIALIFWRGNFNYVPFIYFNF